MQYIDEQCYLNLFTVVFYDEETDTKTVFYHENGILDMCHDYGNGKFLFNPIKIHVVLDNGEEINAVLGFGDGYTETVFSFVNSVNTTDGGTHVAGLRNGITSSINRLIKDKGLQLDGELIRQGLTAILSLRIYSPEFESQRTTQLTNKEYRGIISREIKNVLDK